MSSASVSVVGAAILALLLAGYLGQKFLPPPKPKIVGIDLGTTYSCIGAYHAVTGQVDIIPDTEGHLCIPSVVAYRESGEILVGHDAVKQADHNPLNTFYDAKRFIGKVFTSEQFEIESLRYPFHIFLDADGLVKFTSTHHPTEAISPEKIGSEILKKLKQTAELHFKMPIAAAVISVPAEFDETQRSSTRLAAKMAGLDVFRVINEPTAAALAYGLHNKSGAQDILVIDLGGGTLDVSLLDIQGGMFLTRAMAGNNHLGGQDFNERLKNFLTAAIENKFNKKLIDPEDIQSLRSAVEDVKLNLTREQLATVKLKLISFLENESSDENFNFVMEISRDTFEELNKDLFQKVLEPIILVLEAAELDISEVDEIVMVGGSTRIPKVRELVTEYFSGKVLNVAIDPELAVVTGVSVQAGIVGGAWPLSVSAVESRTTVRKLYIK